MSLTHLSKLKILYTEKYHLLRAGRAAEAAVRGLHLHQGQTPEDSFLEVVFRRNFQYYVTDIG